MRRAWKAICLNAVSFFALGMALEVPFAEAQDDPVNAAMPYDLTLAFSHSVSVKAGDAAQQQVTDIKEAQVNVMGQERSDCSSQYGRHSLATAVAGGQQIEARANSYRITLKSNASALGGHYRTYLKCFASLGFASQGHDTLAEARATAGATFELKFREDATAMRYRIRISSSTAGGRLSVKVYDDQGNIIPLEEGGGGLPTIEGGRGLAYRVETVLVTEAANSGGCCSSRMDASANVNLAVEVSSATSDDRQAALSVGGKEVKPKEYLEVGALSLVLPEGARFNCTGTLISPTTVLTAAHCIQPYIDKIKARQMIFTIGKFAGMPDAPPVAVSGFSYPGEPEVAGEVDRYVPAELRNDIGLLYLETPVTQVTKFPKRFLQPPTWNSLKEDEAGLIIVGYGQTLDPETQFPANDAGIKRAVIVKLSDFNDRQAIYQFQVLGTSACHGDSGGPTFLAASKRLIAVTSSAPELCTGRGVQTRVDAFENWLLPKIKP